MQRCVLSLESRDDGFRVRHQFGVGHDADHDCAHVAENADAQPQPGRLRHPEVDLADGIAGQVQPLARAGHVGDHHRGLAGEEADYQALDLHGGHAAHLDNGARHDSFRGVFQVIDGALERSQALQRIGGLHRQVGRVQAEAVAQRLRRLLG